MDLDIAEADISVHLLGLEFMDEWEPFVVSCHTCHQVEQVALIQGSRIVVYRETYLHNIEYGRVISHFQHCIFLDIEDRNCFSLFCEPFAKIESL